VFVADVRKASRRLGWRPRVSIDEGLGRLISWVKDNRGLFA
jgi:nucleoside-diphosphate-sugar epimerase